MVGMAHHTVSHLPYLIGKSLFRSHMTRTMCHFANCHAAVEYCGVKTRTYPLLAVMAAYTTASLAIPLLAKILPAWRSLKMIAVFPNLLVIAAYFLGWIPESLSWLLCQNKMEQASPLAIFSKRAFFPGLLNKSEMFHLIRISTFT